MIGGDGDDTYIVDNSKDVVIETSKKGMTRSKLRLLDLGNTSSSKI